MAIVQGTASMHSRRWLCATQYLLDHIFFYRCNQKLGQKFGEPRISRCCIECHGRHLLCSERNICNYFFVSAPRY